MQNGHAQWSLWRALGTGGPTGRVGRFNGSATDLHALTDVVASVGRLEGSRKSVDVCKLTRTAEHVLDLRGRLRRAVRGGERGGERGSTGWQEWHAIEGMVPLLPTLEGIGASFVHRHPDVQSSLTTWHDLHRQEMDFIQDETKHRCFVTLATRALCCHRLSGDIGGKVEA